MSTATEDRVTDLVQSVRILTLWGDPEVVAQWLDTLEDDDLRIVSLIMDELEKRHNLPRRRWWHRLAFWRNNGGQP